MNELNLSLVHPTDGREISVTLDSSITPSEIIYELINYEFIASNNYSLSVKGGYILDSYKSMFRSGIKDNDTLVIIPSTDAG